MAATSRAIDLAQVAASAIDAKQGSDIIALDVSEPLPLADIFVIASGRNEINVRAIADEVMDQMAAAGSRVIRREGLAQGRWVLLDFGDVIVHVFHDEDRLYYNLERLWKDCPVVPVTTPVL